MTVEEHQAGHIGTLPRDLRGPELQMSREQGVSQPVPRQHVTAQAENDRRYVRQDVQQLPFRLTHALRRGPPDPRPVPVRPCQIVQMPPLGVIQPQRPGDRVQHFRRGALRLPLLQPRVVGGAHTRQQRQLLAPEPGHAPALVVGGHFGILGTQLGPPRPQKLPELRFSVHGSEYQRPADTQPAPAVNRHERVWFPSRTAAEVDAADQSDHRGAPL